MVDAPNDQAGTDTAKDDAAKNVAHIVGPEATTIPQSTPAPTQSEYPTKKHRRWTNDPAMFWVTLAGVIAVVAYTSVAAWQGQVMQGQLDEMRATRISGNRAFMTVKGIEFEPFPMFGKKGAFWLVDTVLENSGNTPTKNMVVTTVCTPSWEALTDPRAIKKTNLLYSAQAVDYRSMVFGPKQITHGGRCAFSALNSLFSSISPAAIHLYVYGAIVYRDIFDSERWHLTHYCFDNVDFAAGGSTDDPTMTAISTPCRVRNCVDEECGDEANKAAAAFMAKKIKFFRIPTLKRALQRIQEESTKTPATPAQ